MNRVSEKSNSSSSNVPPKELVAAMRSMQAGEMTFANFRDELANALYLDFRQANGLERWLIDLEVRGELPSHLFRVLESDIQRICAEDVPTLIDTSSMLLQRKANETKSSAPSSKPGVAKQTTRKARSKRASAAPTDMAKKRQAASNEKSTGKSSKPRGVKVGDVLCGRYEVIAMVDGGNMSQVFKARDSSSADRAGALCAIKTLAPTMATNARALRALQDEFDKGASLSHANIVRYRRLERDGAIVFIVMEWLVGETLADYLNSRPGVAQSNEWSCHVLDQLTSALNTVHAHGLVHADIKPGNVMLMPDGQLKLFDFGVARAYGEKGAKRKGFDAGVLGAATPAYASAALLSGEKPSPADDWYSLACIAYRLLSGVRAYGRESALDAKTQKLDLARIDSLSDAQWRAMSRYFQHDSERRPANFEPMLDALRPLDLDEAELNPARAVWWLALVGLAIIAAVLFWKQQPAAVPTIETPNVAPASVPIDDIAPASQQTEESSSSEPAAERFEENDAQVASPDLVTNNAEEAALAEPSAATTPAADRESQNDPAITDVGRPPTATGISDTVYLELARETGQPKEADFARRSNDGAFNVELGLPANIAESMTIRAFLSPVDAPDDRHVLQLVTTEPVQVGPNNNATLILQPFRNAGLEQHRDYRLWIYEGQRLESTVAAMRIRILNPELVDLESISPANSVGFVADELQVNERDSVAAVRLVRMNPDDEALTVRFLVRSHSAAIDEDFFLPAATTVRFEPGASTAKILLPLVNDGIPEVAETFSIDLIGSRRTVLLESTTVRISDDD